MEGKCGANHKMQESQCGADMKMQDGKCGAAMNDGGSIDHSGHGGSHHDHHKMMIEDFKKRLWVCGLLTIPVLFLSPMISNWLGLNWNIPGKMYILFGLSTVIFFYGGWPFLKGLVEEVKRKQPGMMTLIAVAITAAYFYSSAVVFGLEGKTFFWELATLILVMLAGHWIEMRSILSAGKALQQLAELMPDSAHLVKDNGITEVPTAELKSGDVILIKPGEKIPADGSVKEGESSVNESMLTGESKPVTKKVDDSVIGGSINQSGALRVQVEKTGNETYLSKVITLVQEAQSRKSNTQRLADKAAFWLTIVALSVGSLTLVVWLLLGKDLAFAMERMVTVMVISCPHALGLAIPLVAAISTTISAKNGLLIRNRTAFENSRNISTVVFDKTGTLTIGSHALATIRKYDSSATEEELLQKAAAIEQFSEHHIAKGIIHETEKRGIKYEKAAHFEYQSGVGVSGILADKKLQIGGPNMLKTLNVLEPENNDEAETIVYLLEDGNLLASFHFVDEIRESSYEAVRMLNKQGIKSIMLTGDNENVARSVAEKLGIEKYIANIMPDEKQKVVEELQKKGEIVVMTGDGVNDAPALAQADIGIAVGSGTDVAAETADIILVNSDPMDIANLLRFGKETYKKMVQNLIWATAYNVIAIPLAAGVLYKQGIMISPAVGAALMALSTVVCAVNAQLLKGKLNGFA